MLRTIAAALLGLAAAQAAQAVTLTIGGRTFGDTSYADTLISSSGVFTTSGGTLAQVLTDTSLASWASSRTPGAYVVLGFTDNVVVNGPGDDLALFDVGHLAYEYSQENFDTFKVTLNGVTRNYFVSETTTIVTLGDDTEHNVNMTTLDLSLFGYAPGATISQVRVGLDFVTDDIAGPSVPQLLMVAAINNGALPAVPEPAGWALMAAGLAATGALAKRRRAVEAGAEAA